MISRTSIRRNRVICEASHRSSPRQQRRARARHQRDRGHGDNHRDLDRQPGRCRDGTAGTTTLKDTTTGTVLTCASSATAATLKKGSGQKSPLGKITSVTFTTCTGPALKFTATTSASPSNPWNLNAIYNANGVTKGSITKVAAALSGNGCNATVAGTTSTSTGTTNGSYSNKTHILTASGGNLHV